MVEWCAFVPFYLLLFYLPLLYLMATCLVTRAGCIGKELKRVASLPKKRMEYLRSNYTKNLVGVWHKVSNK